MRTSIIKHSTKTIGIIARAKDMTLYGAPVKDTIGITKTFASPWAFLPIAIETKPLKTVKATAKDAIIVTLACKALCAIAMTIKIGIASKLLVTAKAKVTMPKKAFLLLLLLFLWLAKIGEPSYCIHEEDKGSTCGNQGLRCTLRYFAKTF